MNRRSTVAALAALAALLGGCASAGGAREDGGAPVVLVAGATGGTGQEVVREALGQGYRVRVLVRDSAKAYTLFGDRVSYAVGDVREPRSLRAAVRGARYVISALGSNTPRDPENSPQLVDFAGVKALAEAARAAGVEHFVLVSSMGVTHRDHPLNRTLDGILEWKLKGEEAVRASGVRYTIVRPGSLTNDPPGQASLRVMQGDPRDASGRISRADLARVLVNALGRPEGWGKTFEIVAEPGSMDVDWSALFATLEPDSQPRS
ncbi:MAG: SDR family oxidoreductase [Pseudomonadota bacterium]|jgi:Predicted nucleoside-diphosphate-sugar epimerases|nr:MAG: hypothetical protein DIU56_08580 [Pseudomonadota bacterium]